jgi:hypothetical protein
MKALNHGLAYGGATLALLTVVLSLLESFDSWYIGPWKESLAGVIAIVVMFVRIKIMQKRMINQGSKLDEQPR